jgi:hypothetical protein
MKRTAVFATLTTVAIAAVVFFAVSEPTDRAGALAELGGTAGAPPSSGQTGTAGTTEAAGQAEGTLEQAAGDNALAPNEAGTISPVERIRGMLQDSDEQRGNMQAFFQDLKRLCASQGLEHGQCSALLSEALANHPDPAYAAMLERIMERLPGYEAAMQGTVMSMETPPRQRYELLDAQRRQLLGDEEAELMYGQEKALAQYRFAYGDLMEGEAASLSAAQRLQRLEQLQEEHFSEYQQALQEARGPHAAFEQQRQLLLLGVDDPQQREVITRQLREEHFDPETVAKMEARDEQVARQQAVLDAYKADVRELQASLEPLRDTLTESQWQSRYQQELKQLRLKHFSE